MSLSLQYYFEVSLIVLSLDLNRHKAIVIKSIII